MKNSTSQDNIRQLNENDIHAAENLIKQHQIAQYSYDMLLSMYHNPQYIFYGYYENNTLFGIIIALKNHDKTADIITISVHKNHLRQKIGTKLLSYIINHEKIHKFFIEVNVANTIAISMYQKHGFHTINIRKKYYKDQTDALLMVKVAKDSP